MPFRVPLPFPLRHARTCAAALGALASLTLAPAAVRAQATAPVPAESPLPAPAPRLLAACYVPGSGTMYRIRETGTPVRCAVGHVEFTWTDATLAGETSARTTAGDATAGLSAAKGSGTGGGGGAGGTGSTAGGDLSGTYPNPTVARLQGQPVAPAKPADGQTLVWLGGAWTPSTLALGMPTNAAGALDFGRPSGLVAAGTVGQGEIPASGAGTRLMWYPARGAFRAGTALSSEWDAANVGAGSVAFGTGTVAGGDHAVTFGHGSQALGDFSLAGGKAAYAGGRSAIALGELASGAAEHTLAFGTQASAASDGATAVGSHATATGLAATALGAGAKADGFKAVGIFGSATGEHATAVAGIASGTGALAVGSGAIANGTSALAIGGDAGSVGASAIAVGVSSRALAAHALAVGTNANAAQIDAIAVGRHAEAADASAAAFGYNAKATGQTALAVGTGTVATGIQSIALGVGSTASGYRALALGSSRAKANRTGAVVIVDGLSEGGDVTPVRDGEVAVRAAGGFRLYTNSALTTGCSLLPGSGSWACTSSRHEKRDFASVDGEALLGRLATLPITTWRYAGEGGVRHLGPMAQDFAAAFGLGADSTTIGVLDASSVALAAGQALEVRTARLAHEQAASRAEVTALRAELHALRELVARLAATRGDDGAGVAPRP